MVSPKKQSKPSQTEIQKKGLQQKTIYIAIGILLISLSFILWGKYGLIQRWSLEQEKLDLVMQVNKQHLLSDSLHDAIKRLRKDTMEIERLARERYGMIKPNEEILFISSSFNYSKYFYIFALHKYLNVTRIFNIKILPHRHIQLLIVSRN